jgi:hypothetical protein
MTSPEHSPVTSGLHGLLGRSSFENSGSPIQSFSISLSVEIDIRLLFGFEADLPLPDFSDSLDCSLHEQTDLRYPIPVLHFSRCGLPHISTSTFAKILRFEYQMYFKTIIVFDGRFPSEFCGGRLIGATNLIRQNQLFSFYEKYLSQEVCIGIHCELSINRGPKWGSIFRQIDRERNLKEKQPNKFCYPNVFILDGGYAAFYRDYPDLTTGGYRSLSDVSEVQTAMQRRCQARYNLETSEQRKVTCNRQLTKLRTFT